MPSITLHNLDADLDKKLRTIASAQHTSLNKTIQNVLRDALGLQKQKSTQSRFSELAGDWTEADAEEFEHATKDFSKIDDELWK